MSRAGAPTKKAKKKPKSLVEKLQATAELEPKPDIIDPVFLEALAGPGSGKARFARYTLAEVRLQLAGLEQLMKATHSDAQMCRAMRERFGVTPRRVEQLQRRIRDKWKFEDEANAPSNRASAIRRLKDYIELAKGKQEDVRDKETGRVTGRVWVVKPDYQALFRFEALLADLEGTRAPTKLEVNVNARLTGALGAVIANLTPEQIEERLAAARMRRDSPPELTQ